MTRILFYFVKSVEFLFLWVLAWISVIINIIVITIDPNNNNRLGIIGDCDCQCGTHRKVVYYFADYFKDAIDERWTPFEG